MNLFLLLLLLIPFAINSQNTLQVPSIYPSIQAGINAASDGDTILLAAGIYYETNINLQGKEIVILGESGAENTLVDGGFQGGIFRAVSGETFNTELIGLTIQYGKASTGSAIHIINSSHLTLRNCVVRNNSAPGIWTRAAITIGQVYNNGPRTPAGIQMYDCELYNNSGYYGGAVFNEETGNTLSIFERCTFHHNVGQSGGGAMFGTLNSIIKNCLFYANSEAIVNEKGHPLIENCTFADNFGPAIRRNDPNDTTVVRNCIFYNNTETISQIGWPENFIMEYCLDEDGNPGTGNFSGDPLFSGIQNYTLLSNSPAIDKGHPGCGYQEPDGTRNDIGAFFHDQSYTHISELNGPLILSGSYLSGDSLLVTGSVLADSFVTLEARESIRFLPGFEVIAGGELLAFLEPCGWDQQPSFPPTSALDSAMPKGKGNSNQAGISNNKSVKFYPNPFSDNLTVVCPESTPGPIQVELFTTSGLQIYRHTETSAGSSFAYTFQAGNLPAGLYFLVVQNGGNRVVEKVVRE
jgi:hypothetical protein